MACSTSIVEAKQACFEKSQSKTILSAYSRLPEPQLNCAMAATSRAGKLVYAGGANLYNLEPFAERSRVFLLSSPMKFMVPCRPQLARALPPEGHTRALAPTRGGRDVIPLLTHYPSSNDLRMSRKRANSASAFALGSSRDHAMGGVIVQPERIRPGETASACQCERKPLWVRLGLRSGISETGRILPRGGASRGRILDE